MKSLTSIKESLQAAISPMVIYAIWGFTGTALAGVYFFAPGALTFGETTIAALWPGLLVQLGLTVLQGAIHNYFYESEKDSNKNKTKQSILASTLSNIIATILGACLSVLAPIIKKNLIFIPGMLLLGAKSMPYLYGLTLVLEAAVGIGIAFAHYQYIHKKSFVDELSADNKKDAVISNNSKWIDSLYFGLQAYLGMKVGFYGASNTIKINNNFFDKMGETAIGQSSYISNAAKKFFEWAAPSLLNSKMPIDKQKVFMVFSTGISQGWQAARGFCPSKKKP